MSAVEIQQALLTPTEAIYLLPFTPLIILGGSLEELLTHPHLTDLLK